MATKLVPKINNAQKKILKDIGHVNQLRIRKIDDMNFDLFLAKDGENIIELGSVFLRRGDFVNIELPAKIPFEIKYD